MVSTPTNSIKTVELENVKEKQGADSSNAVSSGEGKDKGSMSFGSNLDIGKGNYDGW